MTILLTDIFGDLFAVSVGVVDAAVLSASASPVVVASAADPVSLAVLDSSLSLDASAVDFDPSVVVVAVVKQPFDDSSQGYPETQSSTSHPSP